MSSLGQKTRIPVGYLRKGLYIAEPDRPWTEIPLLFQGFEIRTDEEMAILREHCVYVYVDVARSDPEALESARAESGSASARRRRRERDAGSNRLLFHGARHPDRDAFGDLVREAAGLRTQARDVVRAAMDDVRLGRSVDTYDARELIGELVDTVSSSPSASLWLTCLRDKDESTSLHSVNVCVLALAFTMHLGMERAELERIGLGALLHDIGKTRIPAAILNKPGALTAEEFELVKRHPDDGHEQLAGGGDVPRTALDIVRLHHERRGGQGYPLGLSGDDIPPHVLAVGLVNRYDALTSDRPYRYGLPADQALQELYEEAATQFGREPVEQFIRCVGIYPVGSLVELDNGALGVVVGCRPDARLQPTVLLVRTPDGDFYDKRLLLNLAADAEADDPRPARRIRRVVNPAAEDVDVAAIVAFEFGFDLRSRG